MKLSSIAKIFCGSLSTVYLNHWFNDNWDVGDVDEAALVLCQYEISSELKKRIQRRQTKC
jgi:hypothetical protein